MNYNITGKIATIINSDNIVINIGLNKGVKNDMEFDIILNIPTIIDPDNPDNVLKGIYFVKGTLVVRVTYDNMSFCELQRGSINIEKVNDLFNSLKLNDDNKLIKDSSIIDEDWKIKKGDEVTCDIRKYYKKIIKNMDIKKININEPDLIRKMDHFYTTNKTEKDDAIQKYKYFYEGIQCWIFINSSKQNVPLYRLFKGSTNDHFYTSKEAEKNLAIKNSGYKDEGLVGYVLPQEQHGFVPLYRLKHLACGDHFYTISEYEKNLAIENFNYSIIDICCYVSPIQGENLQPLFRLFKDFK